VSPCFEPKRRLTEPGTLFFETVAPEACAKASAGVNVVTVPPEPFVPTVAIVTVSGFAPVVSIVSVWPGARPVTLARWTPVSPAAAAADSVVVVALTSCVPPHDAF
jgi:hypothetical protein